MNRRRFMIASIAMILSFVVGTTVFLFGQEEYSPQDHITGIDPLRSQVYLTGSGYDVDKERDKIHKKEEKKRDEIQQKEKNPSDRKQNKNPVNSRSVKQIKKERSAKKKASVKVNPEPSKKKSKREDPQKEPTKSEKKESEEERARKPIIKTSIVDGEIRKGTKVTFTVTVTDHKGRNIPVYSEDDGSYSVVFNGEQLYSTGSSGNKTSFKAPLADGSNNIQIYAVDREGHAGERIIIFTGRTSENAEVIGRVSVVIEADILNLPTIFEGDVDLHPDDTAKDVLDDAFAKGGIVGTYDGDYLTRLSKPGIGEGAYIDDETQASMAGTAKTSSSTNKLEFDDFYDGSGWVYTVNGVRPGPLGSYVMEDGDVIVLSFILKDL